MFDSKTNSERTSSGSLWSGQSSLTSVAALHKALSDQKEALAQRVKHGKVSFTGGSITVRLSLGKVFQKLELAYPDIYIYIYKQKVLYRPHPFSYTYQLCGAGSAPSHTPSQDGSAPGHSPDSEERLFCKRDAKFEYYRAEEYNWNYLDQHVMGFSEFDELQEVHNYVSNPSGFWSVILVVSQVLVVSTCSDDELTRVLFVGSIKERIQREKSFFPLHHL